MINKEHCRKNVVCSNEKGNPAQRPNICKERILQNQRNPVQRPNISKERILQNQENPEQRPNINKERNCELASACRTHVRAQGTNYAFSAKY